MHTKSMIYFFLAVLSVVTGIFHKFRCLNNDSIFIKESFLCDGIPQCADSSDETEDLCKQLHNPEPINHFNCGDGQQIPKNFICDGKLDCINGDDEIFHRCVKNVMSCILPKPTASTKYAVIDCANSNCSIKNNGHRYVPLKTKVEIQCSPGFYAVSNSTSVCLGQKWIPDLVACLPDKTKLMCPALHPANDIDYLSCTHKSNPQTKCQGPSHVGTTVFYTCKPLYTPFSSDVVECLHNGTWSSDVNCIPECGQNKDSVTMIMHGTEAKLGEWPWSAALYHIESNNAWDFYCGATLISENAVITAAHCVWNGHPEEFAITLGNIYRDNSPLNEKHEKSRQVYKVKAIKIPDVYQDQTGNYGSDVAILILHGTVTMSLHVRPACLPWNEHVSQQYPKPGDMVMVAGWGIDEDHNPSKYLNFIKVPVVSPKTCIETQPWDFRKYITYTTFCAGFLNGTNVCNGDSGSGMMYFNKDKWELVGIVSVSPRQRGTSFCQLENAYALFTKLLTSTAVVRINTEGIPFPLLTSNKVESYIPWLYKVLQPQI